MAGGARSVSLKLALTADASVCDGPASIRLRWRLNVSQNSPLLLCPQAQFPEFISSWLSLLLGELGAILVRSFSDGHGPDAIAVGLALGALAGATSDSRAMGRLERFTGNQPLSASLAQRRNEAAGRWAARQESLDWVRRELGRAENGRQMPAPNKHQISTRNPEMEDGASSSFARDRGCRARPHSSHSSGCVASTPFRSGGGSLRSG